MIFSNPKPRKVKTMEYTLYSIYDKKAELYSPPFIARNASEAERVVLGSAFDAFGKYTQLGIYASDYALRQIARWSAETGACEPSLAEVATIEVILNAHAEAISRLRHREEPVDTTPKE